MSNLAAESLSYSSLRKFAGKHSISKDKWLKLLNSMAVKIPLTLATIWALFGDDIRLYAASKSQDYAFAAVTAVVFIAFAIEITINCRYREGYLRITQDHSNIAQTHGIIMENILYILSIGSFYFWLDLLATASLALQIPWILEPDNMLENTLVGQAIASGLEIGRYMRLVRLVTKVTKWKKNRAIIPDTSVVQSQNQSQSQGGGGGVGGAKDSMRKSVRIMKREGSGSNRRSKSVNVEGGVVLTKQSSISGGGPFASIKLLSKVVEPDSPQSRVGAAMSELTTRRINVLVLFLLVAFPIINSVIEVDSAVQMSMSVVQQMASMNQTYPGKYHDGLSLALSDAVIYQGMIHFKVDCTTRTEVIYDNPQRISELRAVEMVTLVAKADTRLGLLSAEGVFDIKDHIERSAYLRIFLTIFVWFILQLGTYWFTNDVNRLVIFPIEQMVQLVQRISENPLAVEYKMPGPQEGFREGMETTMLLQTINKIGGLMRVCFGEAGASVIARNLVDSQKHRLNLMGPGNLVHAIFGFCDIRKFTDTTECLQEEVMLFVNRI
eukprot:gene13051-27538_t